MGKLIGGKVFMAPNGFDTVRVFRHGYVHPIQIGNIGRIAELSRMAIELPEAKNNPFEAFKLMGWDEITDPQQLEMITEFEGPTEYSGESSDA